MKDTLTLKDGTVIELEAGASLSALSVAYPNKEAMVETWDKLTNENLAEATIKNGDGVVVGTYSNLTLVSETSTVNADGTVVTSFNLRLKTESELRLDALEETQAIQDGAIEDLGAATSELAEAVVGGE